MIEDLSGVGFVFLNNYQIVTMMKTEKLADWHYLTNVPPDKDELYLRDMVELSDNVKAQAGKMLQAPYDNGGVKRVHIGDPALSVDNVNINERSRHMREVGYTEHNYFIEFNDSLPELAVSLANKYRLEYDHYCSIIIEPGQCMPAHGDTYSFLMKQMAKNNPEVKYDLRRNVKRYLVFLNDWEWGQSFGAGNQMIWQWKAGDVYVWKSQLLHWCSNASFSPILFFETTGLHFYE